MDRKVGEIFKARGIEWQCVAETTCKMCDLNIDSHYSCDMKRGEDYIFGECSGLYRDDKANVIFCKVGKKED